MEPSQRRFACLTKRPVCVVVKSHAVGPAKVNLPEAEGHKEKPPEGGTAESDLQFNLLRADAGSQPARCRCTRSNHPLAK